MKRMSIVGLSLLALVAFATVSAAPALAGEMGVCAKASPKNTGGYADKNCQTEAPGTGAYRWVPYPGPAGTVWTFTSKGKTSELKTAQGSITCAKNKDEGEITGPKTDRDTITFEGCTNTVFHTACLNTGTAGKKGGTIVVKNNTTLLEFPEEGAGGKAGPAEGEAWDQFEANGELGLYIAVFHCETPLGEDPFAVTGTVAGTLAPVNVVSKKATLTTSESGGEQNLTTHTASAEPPYSEVELASTQIATDGIKFASKIELKVP